jgi:hypothetical protein
MSNNAHSIVDVQGDYTIDTFLFFLTSKYSVCSPTITGQTLGGVMGAEGSLLWEERF